MRRFAIGNQTAAVVIGLTLWLCFHSGPAAAAASLPIDEITMRVGDSQIIDGKDIKRSAVGDPVIADIAPLTSKEILVNAKSPGRTVIYVWDAYGRRPYRIKVEP